MKQGQHKKEMGKVLTKKIILSILESHAGEVKKLGVKRIGLFGSFAKKCGTATSDLDFLVVFNEPTFDNYMDLKFFLERIFGRKVDLVTEESLKPALDYVKKGAVYAEGL